jgi:hypothetical protein
MDFKNYRVKSISCSGTEKYRFRSNVHAHYSNARFRPKLSIINFWVWRVKMKVRILAAFSIVLFSTIAFAAMLENEWEDDLNKYCEYTDGTVIKIGIVSLCPLTI